MFQLGTCAKKEKYYSQLDEQIHDLQAKMNHNKERDLMSFESEIKEILEEEIVSRYYLADGIIEASFDVDESIKEATKLLNDGEMYKKILSGN